MSASNVLFRNERTWKASEVALPAGGKQRPPFRWSDIWRAPLHDFPIRDEILYQFLPLTPEMDVLEIGPGNGFTAFRLGRQVRRLTLVDIASDNIAQLRKALREVRNLTFVHADVCGPRLAESLTDPFDAVFGLEVFEYVTDPGACLRNLAAVLRPGGLMLLQWPNYPPARTRGVTHIRTRQELDRLFQSAGFETWAVYALKLRWPGRVLFQEFHERPLRIYRRLRSRNGAERPQDFDQTWAFRNRPSLEPYKCLLHGAWTILLGAMRAGGDCFTRTLLEGDGLDANLMLLARR